MCSLYTTCFRHHRVNSINAVNLPLRSTVKRARRDLDSQKMSKLEDLAREGVLPLPALIMHVLTMKKAIKPEVL